MIPGSAAPFPGNGSCFNRREWDAHRDEIEQVLHDVYGNDTALWMRRWRWFFLATAGLFGYADGSE